MGIYRRDRLLKKIRKIVGIFRLEEVIILEVGFSLLLKIPEIVVALLQALKVVEKVDQKILQKFQILKNIKSIILKLVQIEFRIQKLQGMNEEIRIIFLRLL